MADTQPAHASHAHASHAHPSHVSHGTDMRAAYLGLVAGAIAVLIIVGTIVTLTNRHFAGERPAAAGQQH